MEWLWWIYEILFVVQSISGHHSNHGKVQKDRNVMSNI